MSTRFEESFKAEFSYTLEDLAEALKAHRPENGRNSRAQLLGWVLFMGLAVALFLFLSTNDPSSTIRRKAISKLSLRELAKSLAPMSAVVTVVAVYLFIAFRGRLKKAWDADEKVQKPQFLQVTVEGISFENEYATNFFKWSAFPRFLESPNLFILYSSPIMMNVIPKRVFSKPSELTWFRTVLHQEITERRAAAKIGGFPVQPPAIKRSEVDPPS